MNDPVVDSLCIKERVRRIRADAGGVWAQCGVTSWELEFLASVEERRSLTQRQEETLAAIEKKVFG